MMARRGTRWSMLRNTQWDPRRSTRQSLAGAFAACALSAALLALPAPVAAWAADEEADGNNAVDLQQLPDSSFIYDTSILALSSADAYYDEQTVQVTGEVVGDWINGDDGRHCWITLEDPDTGATVAVNMTYESATKIDSYGKYNETGTTLQVRGTYHLVCNDHEGASDLHADAVTVVKVGKATSDTLNLQEFIPGAVLVVLGLALTGIYTLIRQRQR